MQRNPAVRVSKRPKTSTISLKKKDCQKRPSKSYHSPDIAPSYQILEETDRPALSIFEQADKTLIIETGNFELSQFAKSLFLLRDSFVSCLGSCSMNRVVSISKPQAEHFGMLLDFLVASAHESSARAIMDKYRHCVNAVPTRRPLSAGHEKHRGAQHHRKDETSNDHRETNTALYLIEENVTMETCMGAVHARILSARSKKTMVTLGFELQYAGHQKLTLSPFAINYMSPTLSTAAR